MRKAYTFDDVALVPQFNNIPSRTEPAIDTWLTKQRKCQIPILASNMDTVVSEDLANILLENGSLPILHRFCDFELQKEWVRKYREKTFVSSGIFDIDKTKELVDLGASGVCVDVAHGHSERMMHFVENLKSTCPDVEVIAGNVCTSMAYHDLVNAGADAVKVGIGPGAAAGQRPALNPTCAPCG